MTSPAAVPVARNLEYYRKQAKALLKAVQSGDRQALDRALAVDPSLSKESMRLADAQRILARENGFPSWPRFKASIESAQPAAESTPQSTRAGSEKLARMSSDAVKAKTGRGWEEWIALLDAENVSALNHTQIAKLLDQKFGVGPWWRQTVTVGYEQARGLRVENMSCLGQYQVSVSRTIGAPDSEVFDAWMDSALREKWLPAAPLAIRKATRPKSLRITWEPGGSLDVYIVSRGEKKAACTADHNKLPAPEDVEKYRAHWAAALDRLKALLEE